MTESMAETPDYDIEITRVIDAPPERIYQAFIDPEQFAEWYGPVGFPVHRDTVELDPRVGGRQQFTMASEADPSMRTDGKTRLVVREGPSPVGHGRHGPPVVGDDAPQTRVSARRLTATGSLGGRISRAARRPS
jgi:hypothetical protein